MNYQQRLMILLKDWILYVNRVRSDSGTIVNDNSTKSLSRQLASDPNLLLMWSSVGGLKTRSSGVQNYAVKGYDFNGTVNLDDLYSEWALTATGDGTGVSTLAIEVARNTTLTITGDAYFYTDAAGTLGQSQTWAVTAGAVRTIYIKCASAAKILCWNSPDITKFNSWTSGTNAASISFDVSKFPNLTRLDVGGNNTVSGVITGLTLLTVLRILGNNTISGSITGLTLLTSLSITDNNTVSGSITGLTLLTTLSISGNNTISGSITGLTSLTILSLLGNNTVSGSITGLTSLTILSLLGNNTVSGSINQSGLQYINISGLSTCTISTVANMTGLCYIAVPRILLTETVVNQILADFVANKDAAKPRSDRYIDIRGAAGSSAPTGQGITDKAFLSTYKSPNNTYSTVWTVLTR